MLLPTFLRLSWRTALRKCHPCHKNRQWRLLCPIHEPLLLRWACVLECLSRSFFCLFRITHLHNNSDTLNSHVLDNRQDFEFTEFEILTKSSDFKDEISNNVSQLTRNFPYSGMGTFSVGRRASSFCKTISNSSILILLSSFIPT